MLYQKLFPEAHQSGFNSRVNRTTAFKMILSGIINNGELGEGNQEQKEEMEKIQEEK